MSVVKLMVFGIVKWQRQLAESKIPLEHAISKHFPQCEATYQLQVELATKKQRWSSILRVCLGKL